MKKKGDDKKKKKHQKLFEKLTRISFLILSKKVRWQGNLHTGTNDMEDISLF